ncbi:ribbon-helix-helix protein, CopG family [Butyrivibrio sp. CB08]|nr:ribbon-helix-helix protein, CopG family [Butyrivibrio sp. CB08]RKM60495.1 ribbon-helix-helix protein, CopG family [Butyrivibrio sp. CB08]
MIGKDKERVNFTISKEDKEKLSQIAERESRTLSNTINVAIKEYIKKHS